MSTLRMIDCVMATICSLPMAVSKLLKNTLPMDPPIIDAIAKMVDVYRSIFTFPFAKRMSDTVAMENTQTADNIPIVAIS